MRENKFERGDKVRMMFDGEWVEGEVTLVRDSDCKVMWDGNTELNYDYYPKKDLELDNDRSHK